MATYQELAAKLIAKGGSIHRSADLTTEMVDLAGELGNCGVEDDVPLVYLAPTNVDSDEGGATDEDGEDTPKATAKKGRK